VDAANLMVSDPLFLDKNLSTLWHDFSQEEEEGTTTQNKLKQSANTAFPIKNPRNRVAIYLDFYNIINIINTNQQCVSNFFLHFELE
jgi:hypothetical protein